MVKAIVRSTFEFFKNISSHNDVIADEIWANLGKYFETVKYLSYFNKKCTCANFGMLIMMVTSKLEYFQKIRPQ